MSFVSSIMRFIAMFITASYRSLRFISYKATMAKEKVYLRHYALTTKRYVLYSYRIVRFIDRLQVFHAGCETSFAEILCRQGEQ